MKLAPMNDPDFTTALCVLSRRLYRMSEKELEGAELQLLRTLELLRHYRRLERSPGGAQGAGAAHLSAASPALAQLRSGRRHR